MPNAIPQAIDDHTAAAIAKATAARQWPRYLLSSVFAGAFVGFAVVLMVAVSAPLVAEGSGIAKLVQGSVFGVALVLVVFAGAELFTGNAMVMLQGWWRRLVGPADVARVWGLSLVGNLIGSIALAAAVHGGGTLTGPGANLIAAVTAAKDSASGPQLFWRAVLCNALVCLALWMATRATTDGAKIACLWFALLAFIGSGFEHSIANMTIFGLGVFEGSTSWGALVRNLAWTVPGNVVGGGLVIGLGYAWLAGSRVPATATAESASVTTDLVAGAERADDLIGAAQVPAVG